MIVRICHGRLGGEGKGNKEAFLMRSKSQNEDACITLLLCFEFYQYILPSMKVNARPRLSEDLSERKARVATLTPNLAPAKLPATSPHHQPKG